MMKGSKGIVGLFLALFVLISGVCVGDDSADILNFLPAFIRAKFGKAVAKPFFIVPGASTPVTITVYVPDADLVPDSVQLKEGTVIIGNLTDTGNKVFSITSNFQKDKAGVVRLSISATFGTMTRTIARFPLRVLDVPTIQNATQYNQIIDNLFSTLVASQENFRVLKDPATNSGTISIHLKQVINKLLSVYSALEAIYRAETHSPSNYPRAAVSVDAKFLGIGDYLQSGQDICDDMEAFRDDRDYANNPRYAAIREFMNVLGHNIDNPEDRYKDAGLFLVHSGANSKFATQFIPVAETTITKQLGEQFTDLAGNAIGPAYGGVSLFGNLIGKGINAVGHIIIDIFISNTGKKGFIVAEVQDGEALQLPAGSHDVLFSFGGVLDRAIERNIPVSPNLTTTVNITPGDVKLCKYSYQDLGTGSTAIYGHNPYSINNNGCVAGGYMISSGMQAFFWTPSGGMQSLDTSDGGWACGINNNNEVVGFSVDYSLGIRAFKWSKADGMKDLVGLSNAASYAYGLNDNGWVVGSSDLGWPVSHAFLWTPSGGMQDIGTLGGDFAEAYSINNGGNIVGMSYSISGTSTAFLWTPSGGMQNLNDLATDKPSGTNLISASCINNNNQIVGSMNVGAFLWSASDGFKTLGQSSMAYGINNYGHVVGSGAGGAFLWTPTEGMKDLNNLVINLPTNVTLTWAYSINDAGQIVGVSSEGTFLLTPIP